MIKVKGTAKLFPPDEDVEVLIMAQFADYLSPEIRAITVDDDGLLTAVATDPEDDDTPFVAYLPFSMAESLAGSRTIQYSKLQNLDRLGPGVDLASYTDEFGIPQKVVFKFNLLDKPLRLRMAWDEINLLKNLPPHPNIVPFDRVVLDDVESRILGFTTKYIPGGTLDDANVPFRFEWLQQLTQLVDYLNLHLGIMHQDIAHRSLLIDPDTNKILLFDFDRAACGEKRLVKGRNDVAGVVFTMYQLITKDTRFTSIPHWDRNIDMVQSISEWPCHQALDSDVSRFRNFLNDWVATRKSGADLEQYLNADNQLTWPDRPTAPDYNVPFELGNYSNGETLWATGPRSRRTALEKGQYCFHWERPSQKNMLNKIKSNTC